MRLMGGGAGLAAIGACDAFAIEPRFALTVKHWRIPHAQWPAAARPLRIGILTDLHAVEPYMPVSRIGEIVERLNGLQPDIIVLLGDYVASLQRQYYTAKVPVAAWVGALAPLKAPLGVYAVLGNHDWWAGEAGAIRQAFARTGIHLLENAAVKIPHGSHPFWLAGLGDQLAHHKRGVDDLPGTLKQVRDNAPVILMAHEPDIFPKVPARVTLTLSGHTHGGQSICRSCPSVTSIRAMAAVTATAMLWKTAGIWWFPPAWVFPSGRCASWCRRKSRW
jgi:predicted MPP superfamily phosphohydrolase